MRKIFSLLYIVFILISCDTSLRDTDSNMLDSEVKEKFILNNKKEKKQISIIQSPTPNISKLLVSPPPPPMGNGELISFAVTEEIPIKDILIELGRLADIDIEIDPSISGGIILKISNKPLDVVIKRICELANLRWSYTNNILRFEKDTPYLKTYNIDFLIEDEIWSSMESSLKDIIDINTVQEEGVKDTKLIVNKNASVITIFANEKSQLASQRYLEHIKENYSAQVLIEAKVVSVNLKDEFSAGVDWSFLNQGKGNVFFLRDTSAISADPTTFGGNITKGILGGNLTGAIKALQNFGSTKTVASPRVHTMNNQKAELKFMTKLVYFSIEKEDEEDSNGNKNTTYTSTKQEEEEGVMLSITPSINLNKNEITLNVTPEIKKREDWVTDPTEDKNKIPVISTRTIKTSVKIKSGNILVIGGLMSDETHKTETSVPFLGRIPILGWLFKSSERNKGISETIIFIKATIVKPDNTIKKHEKDVLEYFWDKDNFFKNNTD